ncbi:PAS domain S-box-containing protein [Bacillus ectoiniformans]|nr:PAS domain S-box-containing protein [Bacillus ectoiniformans]
MFIFFANFVSFFSFLYEPYKENFLTLHLIFEFISIIVSIIIASHGWVAFNHTLSTNRLIFSSVFVSVGLFDLMHTVAYKGMPYFIVESSTTTATWFWVLARLSEAAVFAYVVFLPEKTKNDLSNRWKMYLFFFLFAILISAAVFLYADSWPTLIDNGHPTLLKNSFEYLFIFIHALVLLKGFNIYLKTNKCEYLLVILSSFSLILSSWMFTSYESIDEYRSLAGHLFKVLGYYFLVRIIFKINIEYPYRRLKEYSERNKLLLESVAEGIYGLDREGRTIFINKSALDMLGYTEEELMGNNLHHLIHYKKADGSTNPLDECPVFLTGQDGEMRTDSSSIFWRKNGTSFPVELAIRALKENDNIIGTVTTFSDLTETLKFRQLELEKKAVDAELEAAAIVQRSLLPKFNNLPNGVDIGAINIPYKKLSGDFYKVVHQKNQLVFGVADICGKGVPAAIEMAMMTYSMEKFDHLIDQPHHILRNLNRFAFTYMGDSSFVTIFLGNYDTSTSVFSYCNGGHEPGLLYKKATNQFLELTTNNPILGIVKESRYETNYVKIEPGDILLLYTDGLTENRQKDWSDDNQLLRKLLLEADHQLTAQELAEQLHDQLNRISGRSVMDDQTLLVFKKLV